MTILKSLLAASAVAVSLGATAHAQSSDGYVNIGVEAIEFDAYTLTGRLGYNFTEYFAIEGQAGFGIIDDEEDFGTAEIETGLDFNVAGFGVAKFPVSPQFDVFARAGYHYSEISVEVDDGFTEASDTFDEDGFAFGFGGQVWIDPARLNGIRADYTNFDVEGDDFDVWSLAYVRRF